MVAIRTIAIERRPGEIRAAALDGDEQVIEFQVERAHQRSLVDGVYLGRVRAVRKEIGAAFVDIGVGDDAFLNLYRVSKNDGHPSDAKGTAIVEGASILVRVDRDAQAGKSARLTTKIDHAGLPETLQCPVILREPPSLAIRVVNEWVGPDTLRIFIDDPELALELRSHVAGSDVEIVALSGLSTFDELGIEDEFEAQLSPIVQLPGGGTIIIERTSAMTTIDVNVAQVGESDSERAAVETNNQAIGAIARAIRLRNIGGLIAVDFLKMNNKGDNEQLVSNLRDALADDPAQAQTSKMSGFGVVEIARRQVSASIAETFMETQITRSPITMALEALNDVKKRRGTSATINGSREMIAALKGPLKDVKAELESELGFVIHLETSPDSGNASYFIS